MTPDLDAVLRDHPATPETARILAIDPGPERSAWVLLERNGDPDDFGIDDNETVIHHVRSFSHAAASWSDRPPCIVIEKIASYGMAVGAEVFETCVWTGRFIEAAQPAPVARLTRLTVKTHLCHSAKANDANIRAALIDRYGGPAAIRKGGPLHGVSKDVWAALAVAVTYQDQREETTR